MSSTKIDQQAALMAYTQVCLADQDELPLPTTLMLYATAGLLIDEDVGCLDFLQLMDCPPDNGILYDEQIDAAIDEVACDVAYVSFSAEMAFLVAR